MDIVLTWKLKKDLDTIIQIIESLDNGNEKLIEWFGQENYKELLSESNGDVESAGDWVKGCLQSSIRNLSAVLQQISNETQDNELVQKRLNAVGFVANKHLTH